MTPQVILGSKKYAPRIKENASNLGSDTDDTEMKELEIQHRKDAEMRKLQDEIEKSVSSLFKNDPKIGQNRSTVIVDKLSNIVKPQPPVAEKSQTEMKEEKETSPGSSGTLSNTKKIATPSSPRLLASPMGSPRVSPRLLVLGNRVRSEGGVALPNLMLPYTPMNTPRLECNVLSMDVNSIPGAISFMKPLDDVIGKFRIKW